MLSNVIQLLIVIWNHEQNKENFTKCKVFYRYEVLIQICWQLNFHYPYLPKRICKATLKYNKFIDFFVDFKYKMI